jgi:hypothetical protein
MTYRTPLAIALTTLAVAGCGGDDETSTTPEPAATAEPASAEAPYGTYTRTMTAADLKRTERPDYGPGQGSPPKGDYRLTVAKGPDGDQLKVTDPAGFTVAMNLEAQEGLLNLVDYVDIEAGTFCGPEVPIDGAYRYELEGDSLTLEPSPPDPCGDRDAILTGDWKG